MCAPLPPQGQVFLLDEPSDHRNDLLLAAMFITHHLALRAWADGRKGYVPNPSYTCQFISLGNIEPGFRE